MADRSCLFEIHERLGSLSAKEKKVADYIIAAPHEAVTPSIEELADRIGVSESTLFRFVRKLGYEGYQQFRIALATETVDPASRIYEAPVKDADGDTAVSVVFRTAVSALEMTARALDRSALEKAAGLVVDARFFLCLGLGGSGIVAQDAYHKLIRAGLRGAAPTDYHLQLMAASQAGPEDAALVISHTGANKDCLALADELKRSRAPVIALTTYARSPLAKMADCILLSAAPSSPYASEAFSARLAQLAIVDALYVETMERLGEQGLGRLGRMRQAIAKRRT